MSDYGSHKTQTLDGQLHTQITDKESLEQGWVIIKASRGVKQDIEPRVVEYLYFGGV